MNDAPHRRPCCDGRDPSGGPPTELRINGRNIADDGAAGRGGAVTGDSSSENGTARDRRGFLFGLGGALMGIGGLLATLPLVGAIFAPARGGDPNRWIALGPIDRFPEGTTRLATFTNPVSAPSDGQTAQDACWVRSLGKEQFQVFAVNCAHLGCPVRWFEQSRLFMCPCHGGVYYEDGSRASGPPPRGLFTYQWRVVGGRLEILGGRLPGLQEGT